jgi:hypothetical protein
MIHIASATYRPEIDVINRDLFKNFIKRLGGELSNVSVPCNCSFLGYSAWRQPDPAYPTLTDKQVFVVRDGRVHFLKPRHLIAYDADGVNWGDSGKGATQLAFAMLAEVFNGGIRSQRLAERFRDEFIVRIPRNVNWTIDGAEVLAIALALESQDRSKSNSTATSQQNPWLPASGIVGQSSPAQVSREETVQYRSDPDKSNDESEDEILEEEILEKKTLNEDKQRFLKAAKAFKTAAYELEKAFYDFEAEHREEAPVVDRYPFEHSFDEVSAQICAWFEDLCEWAKPSSE